MQKYLAEAGASVVVNYSSSKAGADKVVAAITAEGGKAVAVQANVADEQDIRKLFAETKKAYGRLDILVNNAGIYEFSPLEGITADHFHKQFNLNVLGLLFATQEAVKLFGDKGGSVINISSVVSEARFPNAFGLQRDERRCRCNHAFALRGTRTQKDSRQRDQPRHGRDRRNRDIWNYGKRHAEASRSAHAARSHWQAARYRGSSRVSRVERLRLVDRRNAVHFRGIALRLRTQS